MHKSTITINENTCEIRTFSGEFDFAALSGSKCLIVTDANVYSAHYPEVCRAMRFPVVETVVLAPGEENKTYGGVSAVYNALDGMNAGRDTVVAALGGGVVCDLAGFAAATYMRGTRLVMIPTTVIAQADAGIGGKNGYNRSAKNSVGTFYQPSFVYNNVKLLDTLPREQLLSGMGELIKYGYIEPYYMGLLLSGDAAMEGLIAGAVRIKAGIVERDERDTGARIVLNFGHSFGHALELSCQLPHGIAVALGILAALSVSVKRGLPETELGKAECTLRRFGLPTSVKADGSVIELMKRDKKNRDGKFRMILASDEGLYASDVGEDEIRTAILYINREK